MKKILQLVLLFVFSIKLFGQLDTQHWFAPMFDGQSNSSSYQYLYLSTNAISPVTVTIYNNNIEIQKVTISKGSPTSINITIRDYIITNNEYNLNTVGTRGLYLEGSAPFYASLRFGMLNHAEIITSKGRAGIGKEFYTVSVPNSLKNGTASSDLPNIGFGAGFLATQDNTTVTVSGFKKPLIFNNLGAATDFTFKLNKGESYIIDGRADNDNNKDGFIGASVKADKPISVTNGSFNGQFSTIANLSSGTDIFMDQSVPVDKLGDEFVIVKGYGKIGNKMEGAVIVATEPNTQIFLNDSTVPVVTLLNPGDYYTVEETSNVGVLNFINRGNDHYNLHIKASRNIYVYQMMGGVEDASSGGTPLATGGMNYIPPLNCYLPREIDEIGSINMIGNNVFTTKLNIITEKGAKVMVNGVVPNILYGPYDTSSIPSNQKWVTYSIPNQTGNITVKSDKAVTAGLSGGNVSAGFGGYFAGFSSIPLIDEIPPDVCLPSFPLKISEGFDKYKWMFQDKDGNISIVKDVSGTTPNANTIVPTEIGYYWVEVQQGSCNPVVTDKKRVLICGNETSVSYNICDLLPPTGVKLSLDNVQINEIREEAKPKNGVLVIDNTAKTFSYIPNAGATDDEFIYEIVTADPSKNEKVKVRINIKSIATQDTIIKGCKIDATRGSFDLRKVSISDASATKTFYKDQNNADNDTGINTITAAEINSGAYLAPEGIVYLRLDNVTCKKTIKVDLRFYPVPDLVSSTYLGCDEDYSGIQVKLDQIAAQLLNNATAFPDIKFYLNSSASGTSLPNDWSYSSKTTVYMLVNSPDGCSSQTFPVTFDVGTRIPLLKTLESYTLCDPNLDGTENTDLNNYKNLFLSTAQLADTDIKTYFYFTLEDAQKDQNKLPSGNITITADAIYHYRFEKSGVCSNVGSLSIKFTKGFASTTIQPTKTICETATTEINAGTAHDSYDWFSITNPSQVIPSTQKVTLGPGKYYVVLTSPNGCEYKQNFEIIGSPKAVLDISKLNATFCDNQLKGQIDVKLSTQVTPFILQNPHPDIKMEYYRDAAYTQLINSDNFSYNADTRVYVKAVSAYCSETRGFIDFKIGNKVALYSMKETIELCDDDLDGKFKVSNLNDYIKLFTTNPDIAAKFYVKESDAKIEAANNITEIDVNNLQILHIRFYDTTGAACPTLGELTIKIKVPKKSDLTLDKTICPDDKIDVQAALSSADFQSYDWYDETDPSTVIRTGYIATDLPVGKYFVMLTGNYPNDCPYKQSFEIKAAELPEIDGIEISGSTIKIIASGGRKPYRYAVDGSVYQDSNVFTNLEPGLHKAYVVSADNCDPVEKEFSVIKIYNLITPNDDGVNDALDMSLLKYKENVKFQIFDRVGKRLFEGDTNNNYIWDGKLNGKPLPTSSYWYIMEWQDFVNSPPVKYSGWILLKNRTTE